MCASNITNRHEAIDNLTEPYLIEEARKRNHPVYISIYHRQKVSVLFLLQQRTENIFSVELCPETVVGIKINNQLTAGFQFAIQTSYRLLNIRRMLENTEAK